MLSCHKHKHIQIQVSSGASCAQRIRLPTAALAKKLSADPADPAESPTLRDTSLGSTKHLGCQGAVTQHVAMTATSTAQARLLNLLDAMVSAWNKHGCRQQCISTCRKNANVPFQPTLFRVRSRRAANGTLMSNVAKPL